MYKDVVYRPTPLARVAIATMMSKRVELYCHIPPLGQTLPVGMQPFPMENSIPEDEEIAWATAEFSVTAQASHQD